MKKYTHPCVYALIMFYKTKLLPTSWFIAGPEGRGELLQNVM